MIRMSSTTSKTRREDSYDSHATNLLTRAGYLEVTGSGTVAWLGLGTQLLRQVEKVIREEMDALSEEVRLGTLQSTRLWEESGRSEAFGSEMFTLTDRRGGKMVLGATAEEAFLDTVSKRLQSYRDAEVHAYQIGTKFRDELRARAGLMRGREFLMKDAYSLHLTEESAREAYQDYLAVYDRILQRCGVTYQVVAANSGAMGGNVSHELLARCSDGDDTLDGTQVAEVAHVFQLGDRYSRSMNVTVMGQDGKRQHLYMNSYGVGVSRLVAVMADQNADEHGLRWSKDVSVADYHVLATSDTHREDAKRLAVDLQRAGKRVVLEDRKIKAGAALKDADLIGADKIVVLGRSWNEGLLEIKDRWSGNKQLCTRGMLIL